MFLIMKLYFKYKFYTILAILLLKYTKIVIT